jgi:hypothetical protein
VLALVGAAYGLSLMAERDKQQQAAAAAAALAEQAAKHRAAEQRQAAAHLARCTSGLDALMESARQHLAAQEPGRAFAQLDACRPHLTPAALQLQQQAKAAAEAANEASAARIRQTVAREQRELAAKKKKEGVRVGMTPEDVIASSWGKPERVNRTTNAYGVREQWVYGNNYLYFKDGVLTTIQH